MQKSIQKNVLKKDLDLDLYFWVLVLMDNLKIIITYCNTYQRDIGANPFKMLYLVKMHTLPNDNNILNVYSIIYIKAMSYMLFKSSFNN